MSGIWVNPHHVSFDHPLIRALVLSCGSDFCRWDSSSFFCQVYRVDQRTGERDKEVCELLVRFSTLPEPVLLVHAVCGLESCVMARNPDWFTVGRVQALGALMDGSMLSAFELLDDAVVLMRHPGGEQ